MKKVISIVKFNPQILYQTMFTIHAKKERMKRIEIAKQCKGGNKIHTSFLIDKGHKNGQEIHVVLYNATTWIFNAETNNLVTVLITRTQQLKYYFNSLHMTVPTILIQRALKNRNTVPIEYL